MNRWMIDPTLKPQNVYDSKKKMSQQMKDKKKHHSL
jgi:hypothetical protein